MSTAEKVVRSAVSQWLGSDEALLLLRAKPESFATMLGFVKAAFTAYADSPRQWDSWREDFDRDGGKGIVSRIAMQGANVMRFSRLAQVRGEE